jgi:hypothetical protein
MTSTEERFCWRLAGSLIAGLAADLAMLRVLLSLEMGIGGGEAGLWLESETRVDSQFLLLPLGRAQAANLGLGNSNH